MTRPQCPPPGLGLDRRTGRTLVGLLAVLAVIGWVAILLWRGPSVPGSWSGELPSGGIGLMVIGLTAGRDDSLGALVEEIRRFRAGEDDVDFATERDDELGDLYAAVGDMASELETCEREREAACERAEKSERRIERYQPLVESAGDPMAVLDADGCFEVINEAMATFHGTDREELLGIDARRLVATAGVEAIEDAQRRLLSDPDRRWEQVEVDLTDAEGHERRFEANVGVLRDEDGSFDGSVLTFRDVTERVEISAELRERDHRLQETNERLNAIIEASPDGLVVLDLDGTVELWNPAAEDIFGWSADEVVGDRPPYVSEEKTAAFERNISRLAEGETLTGVEIRRLRRDGEPVDLNLSAAPLRDDDGEIVAIMGILEDITERKQYERDLEESKRQFEAVFDDPKMLVALLDPDGTLRRVNETAFGYVEVGPEAVIGEPFPATPWWKDTPTETVRDWIDRAAAGEYVEYETHLDGEDGTRQWVNGTFRPVTNDADEVVSVVVSAHDVTDRKRRERELERTRSLLELSQHLAQVGAWEIPVRDGSPTELTATEEAYRIYDLSPEEELTVEEAIEYYHPEDRQRMEDAVMDAITDGEGYDVEARLQTGTDEPRWVRAIGEPVSEDGEVVVLRGSIQDITDRKEREQELRERERDLREHKEYTSDILDAIDDVFYVIDQEGNYLRWNESARAVTGYDDEEIASTNAFAFFPEEYHPRIIEAIDEVFGSPGGRRVEAPLVTKEGTVIPYEFVATTVENPAGEEVLVGVGRDISERKRREAALERTTELLEQAQRIAKVGGWEFDTSTEELTVTDEFRRLHALDPDEAVALDGIIAAYHPDDVAYIEEMLEAAIESGEGYDMEVRLRPNEGETRWVRALGEPVVRDDEITKVRGSVQDITEAKEREEAIRSLHDAAQGLLQTESAAEVADLVVETAADVLEAPGVCLYLLDRDAGQLVPEACTVDFEELTGGAPPISVGDEDDPVWNSYATGTRRVVDDNEENGAAGLFTDAVGGGLVVPIGEYGVFVVTTARAGVAVRTRQLVETLIATTEAAFDRLESEASLRERDAELEARNRRLRRQIQLTDVIRRVDRSLVGANSREEIETAVCEGLAGSEDITFAWIGSRDTTGEEVVPRTWAGDGDAYLDGVSLSLSSGATEPAVATTLGGEPTVVSNVLADVSGEAWRKPALDNGFRSVLAIPIAFEEYRHGVLAVYADETGVFGDLEQTVFAELGQTIANAINAVQTREALHADTLVEVTLRIEAPDTFLAQVAGRADCDVEYVGIGRQSGDETSVFFATEGPADVEGVLDDLVTVTEHRLLSDREGRRVYEATVTGAVLPARLLRHGARPKSIRATPTDVSVVVSVPTSTDVREFVEMLREAYPTVELEGRRNVTRATRTRQQMVSDLLEGLTERQLEVLRTAYYAGYFQWPRGSSGEEIAEMLGVTQPTVSRHLRLGQHRLLAQLIEEEPTTVTAS